MDVKSEMERWRMSAGEGPAVGRGAIMDTNDKQDNGFILQVLPRSLFTFFFTFFFLHGRFLEFLWKVGGN